MPSGAGSLRGLQRSGVINKFLFLAYSFVWLIFMAYAWSLSRRQAQIKKSLEELRNKIELRPPSGSRSS
ncbi:MAG: hypothetical protein DMG23_10310 [Acidobacteria bacterium]|nr:MAG: hypothetical protein DMG23_10310 [Acidobacteriota bacterium]